MNAKSDADVFPDMVSPICTRSKIVLEIASELVGRHNPLWQARILLHRQGKPEWEMSLDAASTLKCIEAVVRRETTVTMVNPAAMLALAYRGVSPFAGSQPVRVIAVVPSNDQFVFAVRPEMGLHTFEEIATRQCPLCIGVRAIPDHSVHIMLGHIMEAAGFSAQALKGWGGEVRPLGPLPPFKDTERFRALVDGKINAIFDEAASAWLNEALHEGMTILPLSESTVQKLELIGYRRAWLTKDRFPALPHDLLTIDFSGWPIFVHEDTPDDLVAAICAGLDARKAAIPWEGEGALPVERMCEDGPDTPQQVPLHPGAERFWRERGYLR